MRLDFQENTNLRELTLDGLILDEPKGREVRRRG